MLAETSPQNACDDEWLLHGHVFFPFTLLALIALHIGAAFQDYMTDAAPGATSDD